VRGEWYIQPHELQGIRRIEAEVHNFDGKHKFRNFEICFCKQDLIIRENFKRRNRTICISARKKIDI